MKTTAYTLAAAAAIITGTVCRAEIDTSIPFLDARIKTVVAFKDGTTFLVREGKVKVGRDGWIATRPITDAAYGSVGASCSTTGVKVRMLTASAPPAEKSKGESFGQAIAMAEGRPLAIRRIHDDDELKGIYLGMRQPDVLAHPAGLTTVGKDTQDLVLALRDEKGVLSLVPWSEVMELRFLDSEAIERDPERTGQQLKIQLQGARPGQEVVISYFYLSRGFRWIPSYLAERTDDGKASLEMRGELVNNVADLDAANLYLAVGVPSFAYLRDQSPLVARQSMNQVAHALKNANPKLNAQMFSNTQFTNINVSQVALNPAGPVEQLKVRTAKGTEIRLPDVGSTDAGNLHLFKLKDITIKKGERGLLTIASMTLPCSDVVEWNIPENGLAPSGTNPLRHYWRVTAGDVPLTSGSFLMTRESVAIAQDRLYYTGRGGATKVFAGPAIGVRAQPDEKVLDRRDDSKVVKSHMNKDGRWIMKEIKWVDETRRYTIQVANNQPFPCDIVIRRTIVGRVTSSSENARVNVLSAAKGHDAKGHENDKTQVAWTSHLAPGAGATLSCEFVVRHYTKR